MTIEQGESRRDKARRIWNTLSAIDVSDKTQEKNGLTFLSWAWAYGVMMDNFPDMEIEWRQHTRPDGTCTDVIEYPGGTCAVECTVTVEGFSRTMWLPVMDYKSTAVTNPDSRAINDAKMRCLTKCFAMHGLGHYIYAGEDLPTNSDAAIAAKLSKELRDTGSKINTLGIEVPQEMKDRVRSAITSANLPELEKLVNESKQMIAEAEAEKETK